MRVWLAERVNGRWPFLASVLLLGVQGAILSLIPPPPALEPDSEPEEVLVSRGKPGSRPEDLRPAPDPLREAMAKADPYGFDGRRVGW